MRPPAYRQWNRVVAPRQPVARGHGRWLLRRWIELNREVLVKFWEGEIEYTEDVLELLRPIE